MTIAEQIYVLVKSLPKDQANEVLTFAELIHAKHIQENQALSGAESTDWSEFIGSLSGAWGDDFPDLEVIRAASSQDAFRESL